MLMPTKKGVRLFYRGRVNKMEYCIFEREREIKKYVSVYIKEKKGSSRKVKLKLTHNCIF